MSTNPPVPGQTPAEAADPLVGQLLADRYRILKKLGEGAMGAVYVGEHLRIGRRDAIKVLRPGLAGDAEAIARFTRGTRNVSAIRHPNVCTIYDFSDTPDGVRYLAMEFVEGDTLKEVLDREGRLELGRAVELAHQVAEALQAAHEAGVVHRDLKPGNIMVCRRPDGREQVKVVDFDIAKGPAEPEGEEVTRLGFVVGTPEYMSPEQLMGERLDGRSDLYSLGVVLFRMLTGSLPFQAASTQEIMVQRLTSEPLRLQQASPDLVVPPALEQALQRSLARRAQDRQGSAGEFGQEILAALGPQPAVPARAPADIELAPTRVSPAVTPGGTSAGRSAGRRSPMLIAAVVVVVVLAVAGGRALLRSRQAAADGALRTDPATSALAGDPANGAAAPAGGMVEPGGSGEGNAGPAGDAGSGGAEPASRDGTGTVGAAGGATSSPATELPAVRPNPGGSGGAVLPAGGVEEMLKRQMVIVMEGAGGARLQAARDSARLGWGLAVNRADSATAAAVLAHTASAAGDNAECARWARQAAALGDRSAETLLQVCQ